MFIHVLTRGSGLPRDRSVAALSCGGGVRSEAIWLEHASGTCTPRFALRPPRPAVPEGGGLAAPR
eukprot:2862910-Heterocapsa_arctica.AAC.1